MNVSEYKGVFVFIEQKDNVVEKVSLELLGKGKKLSRDLDTTVTAVVIGSDMNDAARELCYYGADDVIYVENENLDKYITEPYTYVLDKIVNDNKPDIMLFGATAIGRELAPKIACRCKTGLTADCTSLEINKEEDNILMMTRPAFGGNIMATIVCKNHKPQMATVRPGVMQMEEYNDSKPVSMEKMLMDIPKEFFRVEILDEVKIVHEKMNIQDANVLISGGRGIGGSDRFDKLEELADMLEGTLSCSRAVVDAGWLNKDRQVGQTGKTVRPDVYFACGISGAIQHMAGMEESEFIIAINKDDTAPIFDIADLGIVGDVHKIIPEIVSELNK